MARFNSNSECWRIIDALPGDLSLVDMAMACVKAGAVDHRVSTLVVAKQPGQVPSGGGCWKNKNKGKKQQGEPKPAGMGANFLCARCLKAGHLGSQYRSKFDTNGQPLAGPGNGRKSAKRNCAPNKSDSSGHGASLSLPSRLGDITHGSAGMDVCTTGTVILESSSEHKVPLDVLEPLEQGLGTLLVGTSNVTHQGIFVHLGLIDSAFSGLVFATVFTPSPPVTILAGTWTAQLVLFQSCVPRTDLQTSGTGGFRSKGLPRALWSATISTRRPQTVRVLTLPGPHLPKIKLQGLINMGVDFTVISLSVWPSMWPLAPVETPIVGVSGPARTMMSQCFVLIGNASGQVAAVRPYVVSARHSVGVGCIGCLRGANWGGFLIGATALEGERDPKLPLQWLVDKTIWVHQWPLTEEKLIALCELVQEQLQQGHVEPSMSLWNTPIFVIKKVWEVEDVARPPKNQCSDGKHGGIAAWYALAHHDPCGVGDLGH